MCEISPSCWPPRTRQISPSYYLPGRGSTSNDFNASLGQSAESRAWCTHTHTHAYIHTLQKVEPDAHHYVQLVHYCMSAGNKGKIHAHKHAYTHIHTHTHTRTHTHTCLQVQHSRCTVCLQVTKTRHTYLHTHVHTHTHTHTHAHAHTHTHTYTHTYTHTHEMPTGGEHVVGAGLLRTSSRTALRESRD